MIDILVLGDKIMNLKGKIAIVTGGSGGLGGRICLALAHSGSNIVVLYNKNENAAKTISTELENLGVISQILKCDVTNPDQIDSVISQVIDKFGQIDILVNDAAYNKWIPFNNLDDMTYEEWNKIIDINLTGPMIFCKTVAKPMKRNGVGRIVNISSNAGLAPRGSSIAYAVSKAGLIHLTKCMAVALGPEILVNCIAPGYLDGTKMSANLTEEHIRNYEKSSVLKRAPEKDDVANQVITFCETDSTTGQTLVVDSGVLFH